MIWFVALVPVFCVRHVETKAAPGVTAADAAEAVEVPSAFVAVAVNVYACEFDRPSTVHVLSGRVIVHVAPPGEAVIV